MFLIVIIIKLDMSKHFILVRTKVSTSGLFQKIVVTNVMSRCNFDLHLHGILSDVILLVYLAKVVKLLLRFVDYLRCH